MLAALIGAAALTASTAKAAFLDYEITADNGTLQTLILEPSFQIAITDLSPVFTVGGKQPDITILGNSITFNFDSGLSPHFSAAAVSLVVQQNLDTHLVINLHFDVPVSLVATIEEAGVFTTTGNGTVNVVGGSVVLEAMHPLAVETRAADLDVLMGTGTWTASAVTDPFNNFYTDYQIIIDNDLTATAISGTASISKMAFRIKIDVTPIPEPATLSLLGLAAPGLLLRRRRI